MNQWLWIVLLTLTPALELRASIPYGISTGLAWPLVFLLAVLTNIILGFVTWWIIELLIGALCQLRSFRKLWVWYTAKLLRKGEKALNKYGPIGLALFIAIPLPGSGAYTGAVLSHLFGIQFRRFVAPCALGVLIAGVLVTAISLVGLEGLKLLFRI